MGIISLLPEDLAEQLATAEDAGFARALTVLNVPDRQRWQMLMEMREMHAMRVKLYVAQMRVKANA